MLVDTTLPLAAEIDALGQRAATAQQMAMVLRMHRGQHKPDVIAAASGLDVVQVGNIIRATQGGPKKRPAVRRGRA